jgi:hypothetical protein
MKYTLGNPNGMTMNQIIELGNTEHFSKLTCSIIPTIDYWKNKKNRIITELIKEDCDVCFEYPVKSITNATSSYTDVMLISETTAVAVESKWNESIEFLCKDHKAKRKDKVQQHWINIISGYLNKEFTLKQFENIEYQLLHRVASACYLGKPNCKIVYQIFYTDSRKDDFINEIVKLIQLIDDSRIEFYIDSIQIKFMQKYLNLEEKIKILNKKEKTGTIKQALKENKLFHFLDEKIEKMII